MDFTFADLAQQFNPSTLARGEGYARQGKVLQVRRTGDQFDSEVGGSGGAVYRQIIKLKLYRNSITVDSKCSCPMYRDCKHVVAALIEHLRQQDSLPADALGHEAQDWLAQVGAVLGQAAPPPAPAKSRLVFVLTPDLQGGPLRLDVCQATLRKGAYASGFSRVKVQQNLAALLNSFADFFDDGDEDVVRLVAALCVGKLRPGEIKLEGALAGELLLMLRDRGQLFAAVNRTQLAIGDMVPIVSGPGRRARLGWHGKDNGVSPSFLEWRFDDGGVIAEVLATDPMLYLNAGMMGELELPAALRSVPAAALLRLVAQAPALAPAQRASMSLQLREQGLDRLLPLPIATAPAQRRDIVPVPHLLLDHAPLAAGPGAAGVDYALLRFAYDGMLAPAERTPLLRRVVAGSVEEIKRDGAAEKRALSLLGAAGLAAGPALAGVPGSLQMAEPAAWLAFVRQQLPRLREAGWQIAFGKHYRFDLREVEDWYAALQEAGDEAQGGIDWFALELGIVVDGHRHPLLPLLLAMMRQAPGDFDEAAIAARADDEELLVDLSATLRVALPWRRIKPILAALKLVYTDQYPDSVLRLPYTDAARLAELELAAQLRWMGGERLRELGRKLHAFDGIRPVAVPSGLQAELRPYQQAGLAWMQFLREYDFAGILADDMGLGKTIQTLAHILAEKEAGRLDCPALVVAPTSLMANWQSEAARFAPGLRVLLLHGKERAALFEQIAGADLVLTTYALLNRDEALLRAQRFHLLILDEAQYIKNSKAKAAQTARLLTARHRLCLTGTPVQNHLGELWSQFHFLMPGLLGDEKTFNARLRKPIELHGDGAARDVLARRIKPFMLRRTKDKVATELPPKTEILLPVEFGAAQRDLYETVRVAMDRKVREEIDRRGLARSQIIILDALLKLRQVCCDPRLLKRQPASAASAKLETLMELLDTLVSEGRKVLVFSQFTSMLALIGEQLTARAVAFALLTGDTVDRAAQVAAFQGGQVGVFLISLKAGGVGLNLTAADTVIHYDPWWNPATEHQATDRAWRIGQTQPVFVYKLIARGSLEEKIQEMQKRKGELADAVLDPEAGLAQALGVADLQAIFAPLAP